MTIDIPFLNLPAMHAEIAEELTDAWTRVLESSRFVGGSFVERFEAEWAAFCGTSHCVGLSDGTAAIELALRALDIGDGDEVIVPVNTFIATWEAIVAVGARPVPVDVDPATLLMKADAVESTWTPRTAAVIAVHLFGQMVDMDELNRVASRLGILVIEDAAQAHGATWKGKRAGSLSEVGCFSFYPGKNLGAFGDAGAIVTNRGNVAETIRSFSNHGRHPTASDKHILVGANHRLDSLQAAILSVKLPRLDRWNEARRRAYGLYEKHLAGLPVSLVKVVPHAVSSHHLAVVQVPDRDKVQRCLNAEGIGTGIHYAIPCHQQPAFADFSRLTFPVAERASKRILSLPIYPHLCEADVERVARALERALARVATDTQRPVAAHHGAAPVPMAASGRGI